ncbi:MAG TPA: DUF1127 domain-containing protein [Stellaceae bacterium]|nr:DUF1127 domain-containing protein [Stellaceae bacterium]
MKTVTPAATLPMRETGVSWWHHSVQLIALWRRRAEERRWLSAMSERDLRDIGLTSLDARQEAGKPFWRG